MIQLPARLPACKLHVLFDFIQIKDDVELASSLDWVDHVNSEVYDGSWSVFPLRCKRNHLSAHPVIQSFDIDTDGEWANMDVLGGMQGIKALIYKMKCPVRSVRLMRLSPGASIHEHRDEALSLEHGLARLHLPVISDQLVDFYVDGEIVPMEEGELWYMNADLPHAVINQSPRTRVHLVMDCEVNEWLKSVLSVE